MDELVRVARTGGRIVVHEPDVETLVVDSPDPTLTRQLVTLFCDSHRSGRVGRHLLALARSAGIADIAIEPDTWVWTDFATANRMLWLERTATQAVEAGLVREAEAAAWIAALREAGKTGRFFASVTFFTLSGSKA